MLLAKNMFFQVLGLDNCNFVVIYGLASSIYYDKFRIADMVKKGLLDRAMRQFISEQVMTLSQWVQYKKVTQSKLPMTNPR